MSTKLVLDKDQISARPIRNACSSYDSGRIEELLDKLYRLEYYHESEVGQVFSNDVIYNLIRPACGKAFSAEHRLLQLSDILEKGPQALAEIDQSQKAKFSTAWQRAALTVYGGLAGSWGIVAGVWNQLFGGSKEPVSEEVMLNPYAYLADRYDWSQTTATEEEIRQAMLAGLKSGGRAETAIDEQLQALYDAKEIPPVYAYDPDKVIPGKIRYVDQSKGEGACKEWETYGDVADSRCLTACLSMALSYIGINRSPKELLDAKDGEPYWGGFHAGEKNAPGCTAYTTDSESAKTTMDTMLGRMKEGETSPVVIHYSSRLGEHALVVTGINPDGSYNIVDPWDHCGTKVVSIEPSGRIVCDHGDTISHCRDEKAKEYVDMYIDGVWQYTT